MSDLTLEHLYQQLRQDVEVNAENDTSGWTKEDFLTSIMLDYLDEASEVNDPIICPFRTRGLQLNAYSFSEDNSLLNLFVTIYDDSCEPRTVSRADVEASIRRELQLFRKATNELYKEIEKDNDAYEFAVSVHDHIQEISEVHVCCLTNGTVKTLPFKNIELEGATVSFALWDLERLFKCISSGKMRERIQINFKDDFDTLIPCLENATSDKYKAYLAIVSGETLARLYDKYRDRLLEKNVRSFLQVRGSVNKGIRDTLKNEPDMFLAYNNGISVTAESVTLMPDESGHTSIESIVDMQIVNGGQTTASIYTAWQDKKNQTDLSKVFVQMKLSVIATAEDMDVIVPKISACANTQNKVQIADFSANDPFHRKVEELSRTIWAPAQNGEQPKNWFYERARGQYADALTMESTTKRRTVYKETHPYFTKTDLAKFENTWDQLPYEVSEGAQKNFKRFTVRLTDQKGFIPDEKYFQRLVAKAILYKETEKIVSDQKYGGYRANIVTYTLSLLSNKTAQKIDLDKIWREQSVSNELCDEIEKASHYIYNAITNVPTGVNIGEWCKKEDCWLKIKNGDYQLSNDLSGSLTESHINTFNSTSTKKTERINSIEVLDEDSRDLITKCMSVPSNTWYSLSKWAKETNNFQSWQRSLLFSVGGRVSKGQSLSIKQARQAYPLYSAALEKGFKPE